MDEESVSKILKENYNISFGIVRPLRDFGGATFTVEGDDGKFLFKSAKKPFMDTATQSVGVMTYLTDCGFPVPKIIPTNSGMSCIPTDGGIYMLFEFIDGREPEEGEMLTETGELAGRLHALMADYKGSLTTHGKDFFIERYIRILRQKGYPEAKIAMFSEYGDELWNRVKDLPHGYCHGDFHRGNMLITPEGKLYLLDFDTSCAAFPLFDIMVGCDATDYFTFKPEGYETAKREFERFLTGYEKHRTLTDAEKASFFDMIAIRHYQLQATVIEICGLESVDGSYLDRQLDWLMKWQEQCRKNESVF